MSQQKLIEIKSLIEGAELSLQQAKSMLGVLVGDDSSRAAKKAELYGSNLFHGSEQVVEGVFDGQHMIGPDGKQYSIPANYASKSKLVEGDLLKLTIMPTGHFLYKQVGPIDRVRLKGTLVKDTQSDEWRVVAEGKSYKVILASVTYFKGEEGDEVVIMVPKDKSSTWAAVENIVKKVSAQDMQSSGFTPVEIIPHTASELTQQSADDKDISSSPSSISAEEFASTKQPSLPQTHAEPSITPNSDPEDNTKFVGNSHNEDRKESHVSTYGNLSFDDDSDEFEKI